MNVNSIYLSSNSEMDDFIVSDDHLSDGEGVESPLKRLKRREPTIMFEQEEEEDSSYEEDVSIMQHLCLSPNHSRGKEVVGRNEEAKQIIEMLELPQGGIRPLLLGPVGIGKKSIIEKVAFLYQTKFKDQFQNRQVYCLDSGELLAATNKSDNSDGVSNELSKLIEVAYTDNRTKPIIYITEIDRLLKYDHIRDYLLSVFKNPYPFVASISNSSQEEAIKSLTDLNFKPIKIKEICKENVTKIVIKHLIKHPISENVAYTKSSIDFAIKLAEKYITTHPFPRKAINLIQESANRILLDDNRPQGKIKVIPRHIAEIVGNEVGIEAADLLDEAVFDKARFVNKLKQELVGQDQAIEMVSKRVACYKQGLLDPEKPWGVFLFVGSTGVGKTWLAKLLAKQLYHQEAAFYRIDGSEFRESYTTSALIGSPPGYHGHDEGGQFTEALKKNPHMVVLFDEIEKAHEEVRMLFLQVFRDGIITDRQGTTIDCSKVLFICTSNLGSDVLFNMSSKNELNPEGVKQEILPILVKNLRAEFCNRCSAIIPFQPLKKEHIPGVITVQLERLKTRLAKQTDIYLCWDNSLIRHFIKEGFDPRFGMSKLCETVDDTVTNLLQMATAQLNQPLKGKVTLIGRDGGVEVKLEKK